MQQPSPRIFKAVNKAGTGIYGKIIAARELPSKDFLMIAYSSLLILSQN
jgi:hypothetical protein